MMMGLPLAGKTVWINNNIKSYPGFDVISADIFKEIHPDYNPDNVTNDIHEWSVEQVEAQAYELAENNKSFIFDGGGINNSYTKRIISKLKNKGYYIILVHIKTPYKVCLERNRQRHRKVPDHAITDKASREMAQFYTISGICDEVTVKDYFTNNHIFVDMDGVIAGQVTLPIIGGELDFVNGQIHKWQKPVKPVIDLLKILERDHGKTLYILSATANSIAYQEKMHWLDINFDIPSYRRFFVNQGVHKGEMLANLRQKLKLKHNEVLLVDDVSSTLYNVKGRGMNAMHPSEFLTHDW